MPSGHHHGLIGRWFHVYGFPPSLGVFLFLKEFLFVTKVAVIGRKEDVEKVTIILRKI
jgi:hypothetical protein